MRSSSPEITFVPLVELRVASSLPPAAGPYVCEEAGPIDITWGPTRLSSLLNDRTSHKFKLS